MNLIELIPSADVREHIHRTGRTFSDSGRATILYNLHGHTLAEKTAWLRELGGQTQDPVLAKQIAQRLALEEETREAFFRNTPGMFYMAAACEDDAIPLGYYAGAEDAVRRGKREGGAFEVYKYRLLGTPDLPPLRKHHCNPYLFQEEPPSEEPEPPDDDSDHYWAGCARSGRRGIVETTQEEWAHFNQRVKDGLYADYFDACVTVEFPTEQGGFSHEHISPLYLERCQPEADEPDHDILETGSLMLRGEYSLDYFTDCCQKYRNAETEATED